MKMGARRQIAMSFSMIKPGKRGSTMVEAAMVLPLLLLTVLSTIMLLLFFYAALQTQVEIQKNVIDRGLQSRAVFWIEREKSTTEKQMQGILKNKLHKESVTKHYVINMTEAIRVGRTITGE